MATGPLPSCQRGGGTSALKGVMTANVSDFDQRAGDLAALAYRVSFRILGDREEARDVTQETLARAYARWSRVGPYDEAWVTRVATNLSLDVARGS